MLFKKFAESNISTSTTRLRQAQPPRCISGLLSKEAVPELVVGYWIMLLLKKKIIRSFRDAINANTD